LILTVTVLAVVAIVVHPLAAMQPPFFALLFSFYLLLRVYLVNCVRLIKVD